jgi:HEAT repeat protein
VAFKAGDYQEVLRLIEAVPPERQPKPLLRLAVASQARLGRPEAALRSYLQLVHSEGPDETRLLREVAESVITSRVRDPAEHVRIAAYTALADTARPQMLALLEDGLLDSSVVVRARAVGGLGRLTGPSKTRTRALTTLRRALDDPLAPVRMAAMEALSNSRDATVVDRLKESARKDEGPMEIFASAALVKLGQRDALNDILSAATLPDPESRMAAVGVLGRLREPSTFTLLRQSVYDPDPSVRAFAAGALGEFGLPQGAAALTHAITDESPRVRSVAAASLGRLGLASSRALLWQVVRDPVELVRAGAVEGLLRLGDGEAVLVAADLAKHPQPSVRSAAAQALGLAKNRKGLRLLNQLLDDQQPQPRMAAAQAMGKIGGVEAISGLKRALQDSDPAVRIAAAGSVLQALSQNRDTLER